MLFAFVTIFCSLLFLEAAFLPAQRLYAVYLENTILALFLAALIQFAYLFPTPNPKQSIEARIALALALAYAGWEAGVAIWRFDLLLQNQTVEYRRFYLDYFIVAEIVWTIVIFTRSARRNKGNQTLRGFSLILLIPLWLAILDNLKTPMAFFQINMSIGVLLTVLLFAYRYASSLPEATSFMVKISGAFLTSLLAVMGIISWMITPSYASKFSPNLPDHRSLLFFPNEEGAYDVHEVPFQFENDIGVKIDEEEVKYDYSLFGKTYDRLFVRRDGIINFGERCASKDVQYNLGAPAAIFPLLMHYEPSTNDSGGFFINHLDGRLIITYWQVPTYQDPNQKATIQTILYDDGSFIVTYNGLPQMEFPINGDPGDNFWLIGVKPELASPIIADFSQSGVIVPVNGAVQDEYLHFRRYIHELMSPLALVIIVSSLVLIVVLPILLNRTLAQPLNDLLLGVRSIKPEKRSLNLPVRANDEIGFLTASFNDLTNELDSLISSLESRVAARTSELMSANEELQLVHEQVIVQQRAMAKLEERQRLARDLHDSVNQSLHSLVLFSETLNSTFEKDRIDRARQVADRIQESARQALKETRLMLYELRPSETGGMFDLIRELNARLSMVERRAGVEAQIVQEGSLKYCPEEWEENLFWIAIEALNNALKHAQAQSVKIILRSFPERFDLEIIDTGRGFDLTHFYAGGMGLKTMRERAELLGGKLDIQSAPGKGTRVYFSKIGGGMNG